MAEYHATCWNTTEYGWNITQYNRISQNLAEYHGMSRAYTKANSYQDEQKSTKSKAKKNNTQQKQKLKRYRTCESEERRDKKPDHQAEYYQVNPKQMNVKTQRSMKPARKKQRRKRNKRTKTKDAMRLKNQKQTKIIYRQHKNELYFDIGDDKYEFTNKHSSIYNTKKQRTIITHFIN